MKNKAFLFLGMFISILLWSCSKDNDHKEEVIPVQKSKLSGVVEKGPFVNGSTVTVYELDENLNQTGKSFSSTTNSEGEFEISNTMDFISQYIKVSINGFYFNEITNRLSEAPITLEALADVKDKDRVNANLITHLEAKRVLFLVKNRNFPFNEAKKIAQKELLSSFLIKDKTIVAENTTITGNDTPANILIAISSIMLEYVDKSNEKEAYFTQLINDFRDDLEDDGQIGEYLKNVIRTGSLGLDYKSVKRNIIERYELCGKEVSVGNFHYFIDGNGNGELEEIDYLPQEHLSESSFWKTEEDFKIATMGMFNSSWAATKHAFLFDALFTGAINDNSSNSYLSEISQHNVKGFNYFVSDMWKYYYESIARKNIIIESADKMSDFRIYGYTNKVYRAYIYMNMIELWGDLPFLIRQPSFDEAIYMKRTPKEEILNHLIEDLKIAEKYLPETPDGVICSKYLATGILARIYAYKQDYLNLLESTSRIINSNAYKLESDYTTIFTNRANKESLFLFPVLPPNDDYQLMIRKGVETPLMRYSEVLLLAAEASLQQGDKESAIRYINQVRERNKRNKLTSQASQSTIEKDLLEEWEKDLAKEGVWFNALKRFGLAEKTLDIPPYMKLLPIPQRELDYNPNMKQNPGY